MATPTAPPTTVPARFVDSKLFGFVVENACVWLNVWIRCQLPDCEVVRDVDEHGNKVPFADKVKRVLKNIAISYCSSVLSEIGAVYSLKLVDTLFFQHVPHFTKQRRSDSPFTWNAFRDWLLGNWYLQYLGGGVALGLCESFWPDWVAQEFKNTPFDLVRFVRNFAVFRVIVDLAFYVGHRFLHVNETVYQLIHKRHHEHYTTNLRTNWHFSAPDLFIESAVPIGFGFAVLRLLGIKLGRFEMHLMQSYIAFHESGTHLGKPLNIISAHPLLSLFYNPIFPMIDARAVEFHETHHNRRDTNYGITPWLEAIIFKTAEFQKDILKKSNLELKQ